RTVTWNVRVVVPEESDAKHDTVVVPIEKSEPDGGVQTALTGRPRSSSPTGSPSLVTVKLTTRPADDSASTVMSPGTISVGPATADAQTKIDAKTRRTFLNILRTSNASDNLQPEARKKHSYLVW